MALDGAAEFDETLQIMLDPYPIAITILHDRRDESSLIALLQQLSTAQRSGKVAIWHRGNMLPGGNIPATIRQRIQSAQIILLFMSADFIADHSSELQQAVLAQRHGTVVVPVLCRPVLMDDLPLDGLATLPLELPVSQHRDKDEAWAVVARDLLRLADILRQSLPLKPLLSLAADTAGGSGALAKDAPPIHGKIVVLFLSSSPLDASTVDAGRDVKNIDRCLKAFASRDRFELVQKWAVATEELTQLLLDHRPNIVHFTGHGTRSGQIVLEDGHGQARAVPTEPLAKLFAALSPFSNIQCVVLNACYAEVQARALVEHVSCVVGITDKVHAKSAAAFSAGFYATLAAGGSYAMAFDIGRIQIELLEQFECDLRLLVKPGQDAHQLRLIAPASP